MYSDLHDLHNFCSHVINITYRHEDIHNMLKENDKAKSIFLEIHVSRLYKVK